ncbi:MAG: hypothetical protein HQ564_01410 [Candidatus Saganbacteria bacterium]|nr:hypothetical protein [Candidatus Saganbacteria bacterium]
MSGGITKICSDFGKQKVYQPEAIKEKEEILSLNTIIEAIKIQNEFSSLDFSKLPKPAIISLIKMKYQCPAPCNKAIIPLIIEALKSNTFNGAEKEQVNSYIQKLEEIHKKLQTLPIYKEYKKYLAKQNGHLNKRVEKTLEKLTEKATRPDIVLQIKKKCAAGYVKKIVKPKNGKKNGEKKPVRPFFEWSLRGAIGYGARASGSDNPAVFATEERGLLLRGAASLRLNIKKVPLQLDYNGSIPYYIDKGEFFAEGHRVKLSTNPKISKKLDLVASAGGQFFHQYYPSDENKDINAFTQFLRINYRPSKNLSINLDENLIAGSTNTKSSPKPDVAAEFTDPSLIKLEFNPGASYKIGPVSLFAGANIGYGESEFLYGGHAGAVLKTEDHHEANLRFDCTNVFGPSLIGRYYYNFKKDKKQGVGALISYAHQNNTYHNVSGKAFARIKLGPIEIQPFVGLGSATNSSSVVDINGGISISIGDTIRGLNPSVLRPHSPEPLPEEF